MKSLPVNVLGAPYEVTVAKGGIERLSEIWELDRKVMVVTDSGVPDEYAKTVAEQCKDSFTVTIPQGEASKSTEMLIHLWDEMAKAKMTRSDAVIAVGGGVVGDLSGFAAATYMRGIDFYNVPTTVLSQVDSSVGGKTAVDFSGYKNIVGAFHQPRGVMLDADTLKTLPERHASNGIAEAVKMAATFDKELFSFIEENDIFDNLEEIITRAVQIKIKVVEEDEKEKGLRKVLNFGHTLAHALENRYCFDEYYHGECVALGMLPVSAPSVRERLRRVLEKAGLPVEFPCEMTVLSEAVTHDKKTSGEKLTYIVCEEIGSYKMKTVEAAEFCSLLVKGEL